MNASRQPEPTSTEGKKLTALRAFLYLLGVLLILALIGAFLWGTGTTPDNP